MPRISEQEPLSVYRRKETTAKAAVREPLCQANFITALTPDDRELFMRQARRKHYKKHTLLFQQGDESSSIYVIDEGWVRTFTTAANGKEITIGLWSCGDLIGAPDICARTRSLSAEAVDDAVLWRVSSEDLDSLVEQSPGFARNMVYALSFKTRWATTMVDRLGNESVSARVAFTVANLAQLHGRREPGDRLVIERLTHQDIGHMVGASRQWVTQTLKGFEKEGLLECHMRRIIVKDLNGLLSLVNDMNS